MENAINSQERGIKNDEEVGTFIKLLWYSKELVVMIPQVLEYIRQRMLQGGPNTTGTELGHYFQTEALQGMNTPSRNQPHPSREVTISRIRL